MLKFKKSGSGILLNKINKFNNLRNGFAFNKDYERLVHLEFEIERQKEVMTQLKLDLNNKAKEFYELSSINQNDQNEHIKLIKLIEELLNISKTKKDIKKNIPKLKIEIDEDTPNNKMKDFKEDDLISNNKNSINDENEIYNKTNTKTFYTTNNNFTNRNRVLPKIKSPRIKSKLFINTNIFMRKKKLKDKLYMTTLRNQINTLNEKLERKNEEILDYKTKYGEDNINNLENDFNENVEKLNELKHKNAKMRADLEDISENYFLQREENINLKNRLIDFIDIFNNYKENEEKNNLDIEKKIKYFESKNIQCLIYHANMRRNTSRYLEDNKSKLIEAGNLIEKINKEIEELKKDAKTKENNINTYKKEIDNLNNKKREENESKEKNEEIVLNIDKKMEEINKKNKEKENLKKNLEKEFKERKNKYKDIVNKIKEINELIKQRDEEIIKLKEEKEKLLSSKNVYYY